MRNIITVSKINDWRRPIITILSFIFYFYIIDYVFSLNFKDYISSSHGTAKAFPWAIPIYLLININSYIIQPIFEIFDKNAIWVKDSKLYFRSSPSYRVTGFFSELFKENNTYTCVRHSLHKFELSKIESVYIDKCKEAVFLHFTIKTDAIYFKLKEPIEGYGPYFIPTKYLKSSPDEIIAKLTEMLKNETI